jgi:hypothetical protein
MTGMPARTPDQLEYVWAVLELRQVTLSPDAIQTAARWVSTALSAPEPDQVDEFARWLRDIATLPETERAEKLLGVLSSLAHLAAITTNYAARCADVDPLETIRDAEGTLQQLRAGLGLFFEMESPT